MILGIVLGIVIGAAAMTWFISKVLKAGLGMIIDSIFEPWHK